VEPTHVIRLPVEYQAPDLTLADLTAAIELVASGGARRVVLAGLPGVETVAAAALAHAQAAHVRFALSRDDGMGVPSVVVGPLEA
jgi:transposase